MTIASIIDLSAALTLLYLGKGFWGWVTSLVFVVILAWLHVPALPISIAFPGLLVALVFGLTPLRIKLVSSPLGNLLFDKIPRMGDTDRIALEAGTVWWDGEFFSGKPNWRRLLDF